MLLFIQFTEAYTLPEQYLIKYGDKMAKTKITEYFSLGCKSCLESFQQDFLKAKQQLIDTGEVEWIFCPYPVDLDTMYFMYIYAKLPETQKKLFFELIMHEEYVDEEIMSIALAALKQDINFLNLQDKPESREILKAGSVIINLLKLSELPILNVNGELITDLPDELFIQKIKGSIK